MISRSACCPEAFAYRQLSRVSSSSRLFSPLTFCRTRGCQFYAVPVLAPIDDVSLVSLALLASYSCGALTRHCHNDDDDDGLFRQESVGHTPQRKRNKAAPLSSLWPFAPSCAAYCATGLLSNAVRQEKASSDA